MNTLSFKSISIWVLFFICMNTSLYIPAVWAEEFESNSSSKSHFWKKAEKNFETITIKFVSTSTINYDEHNVYLADPI